MKIKVYGSECCGKCTKLKETIQKTVEKENIEAEVEKVTNIDELVQRGVMSTPAVDIDGEIVFKGKVPSPEEILEEIR